MQRKRMKISWPMLKKNPILLSIIVLLTLSGTSTISAQVSSNSCLDCHSSVEKLKGITAELEKQKPKKSAETAGEG
jgi:hypothetical protein